jgi:hypothetical protein
MEGKRGMRFSLLAFIRNMEGKRGMRFSLLAFINEGLLSK